MLSSNFNFVKLQNGGAEGTTSKAQHQNNFIGGSPDGQLDSIEPKAVSDKINLEAYQAYYNTNEGGAQTQGQNQPKNDGSENHYAQEHGTTSGVQQMKIINNIMHINHSGANINIMCGSGDQSKAGSGGQQNNFIFNHTAPINLNFFEQANRIKTETGGALTKAGGQPAGRGGLSPTNKGAVVLDGSFQSEVGLNGPADSK